MMNDNHQWPLKWCVGLCARVYASESLLNVLVNELQPAQQQLHKMSEVARAGNH